MALDQHPRSPRSVEGTIAVSVELERRRAGWKRLEPRYNSAVPGKYARLVGSAAQGAVCD